MPEGKACPAQIVWAIEPIACPTRAVAYSNHRLHTDLPLSSTYGSMTWDSTLVVGDKLTKMAHYIPVQKTMSVADFICQGHCTTVQPYNGTMVRRAIGGILT